MAKEKTFLRITNKDIYNEINSTKEAISELKEMVLQVHQKQDVTNGRISSNEDKIRNVRKLIFYFVSGIGSVLMGILGFLLHMGGVY